MAAKTKMATITNTIGASELATVWADPDFDPDQKAFYYARAIEIPTPIWDSPVSWVDSGSPVGNGDDAVGRDTAD